MPDNAPRPFDDFAEVQPQPPLRAAITVATRQAEPECVAELLEAARLPPHQAGAAHALASALASRLRARKSGLGREGLVQGLMQEFSLSSQEGVALMCLAEALLRIPDTATRDALIRDKIGDADWESHLGRSSSLFVNAATWGLLLTGKLVSTHTERGLASALTRIVARSGDPLIRRGVDMAMRLMGEQFVTGETIGAALANSRRREAEGFTYSYDMLGEAAVTAEDSQRYLTAYEEAIHAIGRASSGRGLFAGPGISLKLSALHPRYSRAQRARVMAELYPRLLHLTVLARGYDIALNIDAEEADRLEISLDLLERLCHEPALAGWNGIGFVIQAYMKRASRVVDFVIDLARRSQHRLMVRLVKGAYWDAEIKRAQVDGLDDFPVFTRKVHSDIAYVACARKLLAAPDAVYPQFATHNAYTLAAVYQIAGAEFRPGQYEFQCLHGMGEPLYEQVVARDAGGLGRPCRIYAPVGTHETLLAYLVRRLLENGSNSSFVNRIANESISIDELVADPVTAAEEQGRTDGVIGLPHPAIARPSELFGARRNSRGCDLASERELAALSGQLRASSERTWRAVPMLAVEGSGGEELCVLNPADRRDRVGAVVEATAADVDVAVAAAVTAAVRWSQVPAAERAAKLESAADAFEAQMPRLLGLIMREAGKTCSNSVGEMREAVDFLRYYAAQARDELAGRAEAALGPVVCISPWNFPLAIFTGQVGAALAAGNSVLAKPAEQTPLIAAEAVALLHAAGVPRDVLQLLPGRGEVVGAALVADARVRGVMFTGSTDVARLLQRSLAGRLDDEGRPLTLIAETGGQNAMIVDSSALPEQVVADVMASAFDSAGQRCSALRVLCVQQDIADRIVPMLEGAMREWRVGAPDRLATDMGPLIDDAARAGIVAHIEAMRAQGRRVFQPPVADQAVREGSFVPPTLIEIDSIAELKREVFGPVLHLLRYQREAQRELIDAINATGFGLTLGVHSRIDETIDAIVERAHAGNQYVNRNMIGAVVGVQPFGGDGLSGTGPKAGGPLYLRRLLRASGAGAAGSPVPRARDEVVSVRRTRWLAPLLALREGLAAKDPADPRVVLCDALAARSPLGDAAALPGPTGERNTYMLLPREAILAVAPDADDRLFQLAYVLAAGARAVWPDEAATRSQRQQLPAAVRERVELAREPLAADFELALVQADVDTVREWSRKLAERPGAVITLHACAPSRRGLDAYALEALLVERSVSVNTAAAGGNASLMTLG
ncbi:MAG TPA: trifunctional transcriptional regulator/proline dehydrogenase/L-glutamate gamma-semialdehyde dehydrogenase [Burkholderiaceae bacterium]|nr:trifunctional transcriptional regulator/proline dehydrogenase/L-glutamate gamma-semialdehyde dehydrogenase [Burkholderiaceae bacterium]